MNISCFGSGNGAHDSEQYLAMRKVGQLLAQAGHTVITGGFGGVGMEAPVRGVHDVGGKTIGVTMGGQGGNPFLTETIDCSVFTLDSENKPLPLEMQFGLRLGKLLEADGFVIAAGGGLGTLIEFLAVLHFATRLWATPRSVVILTAGFSGVGWNPTMLDILGEWCGYSAEDFRRLTFAATPEAAVEWVTA